MQGQKCPCRRDFQPLSPAQGFHLCPAGFAQQKKGQQHRRRDAKTVKGRHPGGRAGKAHPDGGGGKGEHTAKENQIGLNVVHLSTSTERAALLYHIFHPFATCSVKGRKHQFSPRRQVFPAPAAEAAAVLPEAVVVSPGIGKRPAAPADAAAVQEVHKPPGVR